MIISVAIIFLLVQRSLAFIQMGNGMPHNYIRYLSKSNLSDTFDEKLLKIAQSTQESFKILSEKLAESDASLGKKLAKLADSDRETKASLQILSEKLADSDTSTKESLNRLEEAVVTLVKTVDNLLGFRRNQDNSLEVSQSMALRRYIENTLCVPDICVDECAQHKLFDATCNTRAEWDAIMAINHIPAISRNISLGPLVPPHGTIFLLECKQILNLSEVLPRIPKRLNNTIVAMTQNITIKPNTDARIKVQNNFYSKYRGIISIILAIGGRNVNSSTAEAIEGNGYLAISPSGKDFIVSHSQNTKIFANSKN